MTTTQRDAIMAALIAGTGPWDPTAVFIGVFETVADHGIDTVLSDLTLPVGDMHDAVVSGGWTAAHIKGDGSAMVDSDMLTFRPADYTEGTTLTGWYVADAATDGVLMFYGLFDESMPLVDETQAVNLVLHLLVSPETVRWAEMTVMNG